MAATNFAHVIRKREKGPNIGSRCVGRTGGPMSGVRYGSIHYSTTATRISGAWHPKRDIYEQVTTTTMMR